MKHLLQTNTEDIIELTLGHSFGVYSLAVSPNNEYLLSGGSIVARGDVYDNSLVLWHIEKRKVVCVFDEKEQEVYSVAFHPNGKNILSSSNQVIKIWNIENGKHIHILKGHIDVVESVAYSHDGNRIVSGGRDKNVILWNGKNGQIINTFKGHEECVNSVAFSPDGRYIISGSSDATIRMWDVENKKLNHIFDEHTQSVKSVTFSPDGNFILSGSHDKSIILRNAHKKTIVYKLYSHIEDNTFFKKIKNFIGTPIVAEGHSDTVNSVKFSPDGKYILSGSSDNTVRLWNAQTGEGIKILEENTSVQTVTFNHSSDFLFYGNWDAEIKIKNINTTLPPHILTGHTDRIDSIDISSDGQYVLVASGHRLMLWDNINANVIQYFSEHTETIDAVTLSPNGKYAISTSSHHVKIFDIKNGNLIKTLDLFVTYGSGGIKLISMSMDSKYILLSRGSIPELWDIERGSLMPHLMGHFSGNTKALFTPDGRYIVCASEYKLNLFDLKSLKEIGVYDIHLDREIGEDIEDIAVSTDSRFMLFGFNSGTIQLWDLEQKIVIRNFVHSAGWVYSVAFSPDGKYIISSHYDETIVLWEVHSGKQLKTFYGSLGISYVIKFSPDGKYVFAGGEDGIVRIWETDTGKELIKYIGLNNGEWLSLSYEGYYNCSTNGRKYLSIRQNEDCLENFDEEVYKRLYVAKNLGRKYIK